MWILAACSSALFAGLTVVLAKAGVAPTNLTVATTLYTVIVAARTWGMAALTGTASEIASIDGTSTLLLMLSGLATGASWLCYFIALSRRDISHVAPIDKLSTVLAIILALVLLGGPVSLWGADGVVTITAETLPIVEPSDLSGLPHALHGGRSWLTFALASALFAALTLILGRVGISGVDPTLGTAMRTMVALAMAWVIIGAQGHLSEVRSVPGRELAFIVASGATTCASWLACYHALKGGPVSIVVPIDKLSILMTAAVSAVTFHERFTPHYLLGLTLMCAGTAAMVVTQIHIYSALQWPHFSSEVSVLLTISCPSGNGPVVSVVVTRPLMA